MNGRCLYGTRNLHTLTGISGVLTGISVYFCNFQVISGNSGNFGIAYQFQYIRYLSKQSNSRNTEPDTEISGISGRPFLRKLQGFSRTTITLNGMHCLTLKVSILEIICQKKPEQLFPIT